MSKKKTKQKMNESTYLFPNPSLFTTVVIDMSKFRNGKEGTVEGTEHTIICSEELLSICVSM
jgi:hypothetical protein